MMQHPSPVHAVADLRRQDLLVTAEHERRATAVDPVPTWLPSVVTIAMFLAFLLGVHH